MHTTTQAGKIPAREDLAPPQHQSLHREALAPLALAKAAKAYARRGLAILPLHSIYPTTGGCTCGDPECCSPGKHPIAELAPHGVHSATNDLRRISMWWKLYPWANIGIATGQASGIVVLDFDTKQALEEARKRGLSNAPLVRTGRGWHAYLKTPQGEAIPRSCTLFPGSELKADGAYVVAPPSIHQSGSLYTWEQHQ